MPLYNGEEAVMKVVVIPGVGYHRDTKKEEVFCRRLSDLMPKPNSVEMFVWDHNAPPPVQVIDADLSLRSARAFVFEVLLDLQHVSRHIMEIKPPPADVYVGHSAGGLVAIVSGKPCVVMGCPVQMTPYLMDPSVRTAVGAAIKAQRPVLDIMCKYDLTAMPMYLDEGWRVENWVVGARPLDPLVAVPPMSHSMYWTDGRVAKKIAAVADLWGAGRMAFSDGEWHNESMSGSLRRLRSSDGMESRLARMEFMS